MSNNMEVLGSFFAFCGMVVLIVGMMVGFHILAEWVF